MTTTLRSMIRAQVGWTWRDDVGASTIVDANRLQFSDDLTDGSSTGQADAVWHAENQILTDGQSLSLQLDSLTQSLFGDTITIPMDTIRALLIVNRNTSTGSLLVGDATTDAWYAPFGMQTDTVCVMPNSPLLLSNAGDGWAIPANENILKIEAFDADVTYDIAILGTFA